MKGASGHDKGAIAQMSKTLLAMNGASCLCGKYRAVAKYSILECVSSVMFFHVMTLMLSSRIWLCC
jgi:hypothetical protein